MRKISFKIVALMFVFTMILSVNACKATPTTTTSSQVATPTQKAPVTIVLTGSQNWFKDAQRELFTDYETASGNTVDIQVNPDDQNDAVLKAKLATNEIPDVVMYFNGAAGKTVLQADKYFLDLTDQPYVKEIDEDYLETFMTWDGKVYGIPFGGMNPWGCFYNLKVFSDLNISEPKTYEDLLAASAKIKAAGIIPMYLAGKDLWPCELWMDAYWIAAIDRNNPGVMDKYAKNEIKFANMPDFVEGLERMRQYNLSGYFGSNPLSQTYAGAAEALYTGKAAMFPIFEGFLSETKDQYPDMKDKLGYMPFPVTGDDDYGTGSSGSLYINKSGKNIDACIDMFTYLAKPDVIQKFYEAVGAQPFFKGYTISSVSPQAKKAAEAIAAGHQSTIYADFIPASYGASTFEGVQDMLLGKKTAKQVLESVDAEIAKNAKAQNLPGW